jgi:hypothetical protein
MFIVVFVVMLPVQLRTGDPVQAWQAGLAWAFIILPAATGGAPGRRCRDGGDGTADGEGVRARR